MRYREVVEVIRRVEVITREGAKEVRSSRGVEEGSLWTRCVVSFLGGLG